MWKNIFADIHMHKQEKKGTSHFGGYFKLLVMLVLSLLAGGTTAVSYAVTAGARVQNRELPIYSVGTEEKKVALSFDAAWGNEDTERILATLEKHNVRVTFFATGGWVEKYPDDVKKIIAAGHDFGNHSENHKYMTKLSHDDQVYEIMTVHDKVKALTGYEMCLFRPPYGDYNDSVILTAEECGYYPIQWSVDSLDWKDYGVDSIISKVLKHKNLTNGAIILMHNGAKYTADALEQVIDGLQEMGYEIVPISELIYANDYSIDHTGKQIKN